MSRFMFGAATVLLVCAGLGCASSGTWANGITRAEVFSTPALGITGHENNYTLETGSMVDKLSIFGNNNRVTVQWGAKLGKIEIKGQNNTVAMPRYLIVRKSIWGSNNQFIETPRDQYLPPRQSNYVPEGAAPQGQVQQYYPAPGGEMQQTNP